MQKSKHMPGLEAQESPKKGHRGHNLHAEMSGAYSFPCSGLSPSLARMAACSEYRDLLGEGETLFQVLQWCIPPKRTETEVSFLGVLFACFRDVVSSRIKNLQLRDLTFTLIWTNKLHVVFLNHFLHFCFRSS